MKNTGQHDFSGQEGYCERPGVDQQPGVRINHQKNHNGHNGSSTRRKIIPSSSHELHGGRRTTINEGGVP